MLRFSSVKDLQEHREIIAADTDEHKPRIVVCGGTACQASGSNDIIRAAKRYILQEHLLDKIGLRITGCHGFCEMGPFILTEPQGVFYHQVAPDKVASIIDATLAGTYVEELVYCDPTTGERFYHQNDIPFFKKQQRTIFGKNQRLDPIRIYDYIARDGYLGLERALSAMTPEEVVSAVKDSGLRGRGGGGFPNRVKGKVHGEQPSGGGTYNVVKWV